MKTTKFLSLAALALTFAACSNENDELTQQPTEQPADNMITITAKLAPKSGGAQTRTISDQTTYIKADWTVNEQLKIISVDGSTATANIDAVDGNGAATVSFSIASSAKDKDCTIIYPASADYTETAGVYTANPITAQDGTLNAGLDVRIGEGHITNDATPTLEVTTQPAAQFAIFKLTMKNIDAKEDISATSVAIIDQTGATLTTVTPASGCDKVMYVALPITATTLKFSVTGSDSKKYFNMASGLTLGTNFYQSTVKLATVGDVMLASGKCAKAGTAGAVAMIAYLGDGETNTTYNCGLAIALADANSMIWKWSNNSNELAGVSCSTLMTDHKAFLNGIADTETLNTKYVNDDPDDPDYDYAATKAKKYQNIVAAPAGTSGWFLPSSGQWLKFFEAAGVNVDGIDWADWAPAPSGGSLADNWTKINALMEAASTVSSLKTGDNWYWSSSEATKNHAALVRFSLEDGVGLVITGKGAFYYVRSFLAF